MNRPTAVTRKLLSEKWFLSRGKYQGRGESTATSFSHTILHRRENKTHIGGFFPKLEFPRVLLTLKHKTTHWIVQKLCHSPQNLQVAGHLDILPLNWYQEVHCQAQLLPISIKINLLHPMQEHQYKLHRKHLPLQITLILWCSWFMGSKESVIHHS